MRKPDFKKISRHYNLGLKRDYWLKLIGVQELYQYVCTVLVFLEDQVLRECTFFAAVLTFFI